jgi:hypothetical protein
LLAQPRFQPHSLQAVEPIIAQSPLFANLHS